MSRVPCHPFQDRQPRAHLVVGAAAHAEGQVAGDELKAFHSLLTRLVTKQEPVGDYAATMVRDAGRPEDFAFEDQGDARQFSAAVKAEATVQLSGLGEPARIRVGRREARGARGLAASAEDTPEARTDRSISACASR